MQEPVPMNHGSRETPRPSTYAPLRKSLLPFYEPALYQLGPHGDYLLYKQSGTELGQERIKDERVPPLFARSDERILAIPKMQQHFAEFLKTKTLEGGDIPEVKNIVTDWVGETLEEMARGEATMVNNLPSVIDAMLQKYGTDFLVFTREIPNYDYSTALHSVNSMIYVVNYFLKNGMKADDPKLVSCAMAAILHDVGKEKIDKSIILKPGKLNYEEWKIMKTHPRLGYGILLSMQMNGSTSINSEVLDAALHHHERADGSGYPDGLKGEMINELTEVTAFADFFDAITSGTRSYISKIDPYTAIKDTILPEVKANKFHTDRYMRFVNSLGFK